MVSPSILVHPKQNHTVDELVSAMSEHWDQVRWNNVSVRMTGHMNLVFLSSIVTKHYFISVGRLLGTLKIRCEKLRFGINVFMRSHQNQLLTFLWNRLNLMSIRLNCRVFHGHSEC